jgi:hypothetical protein
MSGSELAFDNWLDTVGQRHNTIVQVKHLTYRNQWAQALASGTSWYATPLTLSITPTLSNSKIYCNFFIHGGTSYWENQGRLARRIGSGSDTYIGQGAADGIRSTCSWATLKYDSGYDDQDWHNVGFQYVDSPGTTSTVTYTMYMSGYSTNTIYINRTDLNTTNYDDYYKSPISTVTLMEILQT